MTTLTMLSFLYYLGGHKWRIMKECKASISNNILWRQCLLLAIALVFHTYVCSFVSVWEGRRLFLGPVVLLWICLCHLQQLVVLEKIWLYFNTSSVALCCYKCLHPGKPHQYRLGIIFFSFFMVDFLVICIPPHGNILWCVSRIPTCWALLMRRHTKFTAYHFLPHRRLCLPVAMYMPPQLK